MAQIFGNDRHFEPVYSLPQKLDMIIFYLQKAEDSQLNPVETSEIKLSANKYRIIAKSSLKAGQGIDIRIRYHHPTHPKNYDYSQKVNDQGDITIMPQTQLHPGRWEIHCCSDIISEIVGEYWEKYLYFEIESNPSLSSPIGLDYKYLQTLESSIRREVELLVQKTPIQENLLNYKQLLALETHTEPHSQQVSNDVEEIKQYREPIINLILNRSEIVRQWQETLIIEGRIEIEQLGSELLQYLRYELRHPLTEELVYSQNQPLSIQSSLFAFHHTLEIPQDAETSDLILTVQVLSSNDDILDSQVITIMTEMPESSDNIEECLNYTLELSDIERKTSYIFDIAIEKPINPLPIMVNLPEPQKKLKSLRWTPKLASSSLPPRLSPSKDKKRHLSPKLPTLP